MTAPLQHRIGAIALIALITWIQNSMQNEL